MTLSLAGLTAEPGILWDRGTPKPGCPYSKVRLSCRYQREKLWASYGAAPLQFALYFIFSPIPITLENISIHAIGMKKWLSLPINCAWLWKADIMSRCYLPHQYAVKAKNHRVKGKINYYWAFLGKWDYSAYQELISNINLITCLSRDTTYFLSVLWLSKSSPDKRLKVLLLI